MLVDFTINFMPVPTCVLLVLSYQMILVNPDAAVKTRLSIPLLHIE